MKNFICKEITTIDNEFVSRIIFSDKKDEGYIEGQTYEEIVDSLGEYVMLQRSYGEDEFDQDYSSVEFSDFEKSGTLEDFSIAISRKQFRMEYKGDVIDIGLALDDEATFLIIKEVLKKIINGKGSFVEME